MSSRVVDDFGRVEIPQNFKHFFGVSAGAELLKEDIPVGGEAQFLWSSASGEASASGEVSVIVPEAPSHLSSLLEARRARLEAPAEVTVDEGKISKACGTLVVVDQETEVCTVQCGVEDVAIAISLEEPQNHLELLPLDENGAEVSETVQDGYAEVEMGKAIAPVEEHCEEGQNEEMQVLDLSSKDKADVEALGGGDESPVRRVEKRLREEIASPGGEKANGVRCRAFSSPLLCIVFHFL